MRALTLVRAAANAAVWALASLLVLVAVWFAANRLLDESPHPERLAFAGTRTDQVPDSQNVAVGILGLTAPEGSDFVSYGARVKALYTTQAPWSQIQDMVRGPNTLRPSVESAQTICWLDPDMPSWKGCLPFDQAPQVLEKNKQLLERLQALHRLSAFSGFFNYYNEAYIVLLRLSVAEMHLTLRERDYEAAYRKWRDQYRFARGNLRGPDVWVGKAIGLVAFGTTLPFLESLLLASPEIARTHAPELLELLHPEGMEAFNPEGIARAEYWLLSDSLESLPDETPLGTERLHWLAYHLGQRNRILNRYSVFAPKYAAALRLPWAEMQIESDRLREIYVYPSAGDFLIDPFGSLYLATFIDSQLGIREMPRQMHVTDGKLRLATLAVRIMNEGITDADIPRFLASAGPRLRDPFTGAPMRWDAKDRKIYFPDPSDKCIVGAFFRLPALDKPKRDLSATVNTSAC
jgi:hypothetical protein